MSGRKSFSKTSKTKWRSRKKSSCKQRNTKQNKLIEGIFPKDSKNNENKNKLNKIKILVQEIYINDFKYETSKCIFN